MERTGILRCYHIGLTGFKEAVFTIADTCNRVEPNWADGGKNPTVCGASDFGCDSEIGCSYYTV